MLLIIWLSIIVLIVLGIRQATKSDEWENKLWDNEEEGRTGKTVIKLLRSEYPYPKIKTPEHWEKNITAKRVTKWHNTIDAERRKIK